MARPIEIGIDAGVRIVLREDGSVGCIGATIEGALASARFRLKVGDRSARDLAYVREWVDRMEAQIAAEELETAARRAAEPRLNRSRKLKFGPPETRAEVERIILEQERERLKPKE